MNFNEHETDLLRELGIADYRHKVILNAQPPITDSQLADIESRISRKVPTDLLALWQTSFGGELDYNFELLFEDFLYTASFRELFYPGSSHYYDLHGWTDYELQLGQELAEERGHPIPERTPFIPFGGFEYLERFYVSLERDEYGAVIVYAQGIPWKGRLNEDSVAPAAPSVSDLFDELALDEDPFDKNSGEYASGKEMAEKIREIEIKHPRLAEKLKNLVRRSVVDWKEILAQTDFSRPLSATESRALRVALRRAVERKEVDILDWLHEQGAPFDVTIQGTAGLLDFAMAQKSFAVVERLLDLKVELGDAPILFASGCTDALMLRLIEYGARFDEEAIYSAAETGAIDGAIALANSSQVVEPLGAAEIAATALERATRHDEDVKAIESGRLHSYLTPDQYREQAAALREFAGRLETVD